MGLGFIRGSTQLDTNGVNLICIKDHLFLLLLENVFFPGGLVEENL